MRSHDETGASAVEYGLIVAGIAALVVAIVFTMGGMVRDTLFNPSCDKIAGHSAASNGSQSNCEK